VGVVGLTQLVVLAQLVLVEMEEMEYQTLLQVRPLFMVVVVVVV
jgi:hypothetical protein